MSRNADKIDEPLLPSKSAASTSLNDGIDLLLRRIEGPKYTTREDISLYIRSMAYRNNIEDIELFKELEVLCLNELEEEGASSQALAVNTLIDCAGIYYEGVGFLEKSLQLMNIAFAYAVQLKSKSLQRRAHNCLASIYLRFCNFNQSLFHNERAYILAKEEGDQFLLLAALVNTVAILEGMGLLRAALNLALELKNRPQRSLEYDHLQLINANNAVKISHLLEDMISADLFIKIAVEKFGTTSLMVSAITCAHFESSRAVHLLKKGNPEEGLELINRALGNNSKNKNVKVKALLLCAQAEIYFAMQDEENLEASRQQLTELLESRQNLADHYEKVLGVLIRISSIRGPKASRKEKKYCLEYLRLLREYGVAVTHGTFFYGRFSVENTNHQGAVKLSNPSYIIPDWILSVGKCADYEIKNLNAISGPKAKLDSLPRDLAMLSGGRMEARMRTAQYDVAENWAVAAEFATGADGRHGLRVGRLAAAMARQIGFSLKDSVTLELACRLHNIGNAAIALSGEDLKGLRPFGKFSLGCQHTNIGSKLLGSSGESILKLGASIAQNHHEWWNGCGFPVGLKGENIPLEARICSIADRCISLIAPTGSVRSWNLERAIDQIKTMSGVQVDPGLIIPLMRATREAAADEFDLFVDKQDDYLLVRARKKLFEAMSLICL